MLPGVYENFAMLLPQFPADGRSFDELGSRTDDGKNIHGQTKTLQGSKTLQKVCGESEEEFQFSAYNFLLGRKKGRLRPRQFAGAVDVGVKSAPQGMFSIVTARPYSSCGTSKDDAGLVTEESQFRPAGRTKHNSFRRMPFGSTRYL
jgi:hypothetical protein